MMTEKRAWALECLRRFTDRGGATPGEFARVYFGTDHPGWKRVHKCGATGKSLGGGLRLSAGAFLSQLARVGFCYKSSDSSYILSVFGRQALTGYEMASGTPNRPVWK